MMNFLKLIFKFILIIIGCLFTFIFSFKTLLSANLGLNVFKNLDFLPRWFMAFIFGSMGWMPFISPLWFYYIYPTGWVEKEINFLI